MARSTPKSFKKAAFKKRGVKEEYIELSASYDIRKRLIALPQEARLTQEQLAERLRTNKK